MCRWRCQFVMHIASLTTEILEPRRRSATVRKYRPSALNIEANFRLWNARVISLLSMSQTIPTAQLRRPGLVCAMRTQEIRSAIHPPKNRSWRTARATEPEGCSNPAPHQETALWQGGSTPYPCSPGTAPYAVLVGVAGFETATPSLRTRCSTRLSPPPTAAAYTSRIPQPQALPACAVPLA